MAVNHADGTLIMSVVLYPVLLSAGVRTLLPAAKPPPVPRPPAPLRKHLRILVVEDDGDVIRATAETLQDAGYEVVTATSGPEALAMLRSDPGVDLLFTDVAMPGGLDGVGLAEAGLRVRPGL